MFGPQRRRPTVLLFVGIAVVLGLIAAAIRPHWHTDPLDFDLPRQTHRQTQAPMSPGTKTPPPPSHHDGNGGQLAVVGWVLLGVLVAAALVVVGMVLRRLLRLVPPRSARPVETGAVVADELEPDLPTMRRGAASAQSRMAEETAPTDAIIAGWLELERAAAGSGVPRSRAQTPTEFTTDVLGRTAADPAATRILLQLYLRARFSTTTTSADDAALARQCVSDIAQSWTTSTTAADPGADP